MHNKKAYFSRFIIYIVLCFVALTVLVPFFWVVSNSLAQNEDIGKFTDFSIRTFFPGELTASNYKKLFNEYSIGRYIINTVTIALVVTVASLFINSLAAYAFARLDFAGRDIIFSLLLITLILPGEVLLLPQYLLVKNFGWIDNYAALIVPALAGTFGIFFLRQFFLGVPKELEEAAFIDGCDRFGIYYKIFLPLSKPALITLGLMTFLGQWDGFVWPLTVITNPDKYVLQIGLSFLMGEHYNDWGSIFAGAVVATLPILIIFLGMQNYYMEGIMSSGIKG